MNFLIQRAGSRSKPQYFEGNGITGTPVWTETPGVRTMRFASLPAGMEVLARLFGSDTKHTVVREPKPPKPINPSRG